MSGTRGYRGVVATCRRRAAMAFAAAALLMASAAPGSTEPATRSVKLTEPADEAQCHRAKFRVVLDVGHSAESPGATSARGVPEYEFNLSASRWIERALNAAGFDRTVRLITNGPARPSLYDRVAQANRLSADLFLSIHHDSVPQWFKKAWEHDGNKLEYSDRFKGHSIFVSHDHRNYRGSLGFARLLGLKLKAGGLQYTPHYTYAEMRGRRRQLVDKEAGVYRFDRLVVLRTTRMPAVLFEVASIVNRDEELKAADPERLALVAAAVTRAVEQFCAASAPQGIARGKKTRPLRTAKPRTNSSRAAIQ